MLNAKLTAAAPRTLTFPVAPPLAAIPEFSLGSGSALRFHLRGGGSSRHTSVQLLVRTRAASGTLLAVSSPSAEEYIVLEVSPPSANHTPALAPPS